MEEPGRFPKGWRADACFSAWACGGIPQGVQALPGRCFVLVMCWAERWCRDSCGFRPFGQAEKNFGGPGRAAAGAVRSPGESGRRQHVSWGRLMPSLALGWWRDGSALPGLCPGAPGRRLGLDHNGSGCSTTPTLSLGSNSDRKPSAIAAASPGIARGFCWTGVGPLGFAGAWPVAARGEPRRQTAWLAWINSAAALGFRPIPSQTASLAASAAGWGHRWRRRGCQPAG